VREKADQKLFTKLGRLAELKERRPEIIVGVCGCIAQREAEGIFARARHVDLVLGPRAVPRLARMIGDHLETGAQQICTEMPKEFDRTLAFVRHSGVVGYVTIMEGCNKFCSFCIVPYTRGREVSKPVGLVLEEVRGLAQQGFPEVQLLGQNVNAYHDREAGVSFADLLERVAAIEGIERVRFVTSHPNHLGEDIARVMAERDNICKSVHLPPQSGSDRILGAMRRRYSRAEYMGTVNMLKKHMKSIALSGDVIVGFPGETEDDFKETLSMIEEVGYASLFSFVFSPRPGTRAEEMADDVPAEVKLERLHRLQARQSAIQYEVHRRMVGTEQKVLFDGRNPKREGQLVGRTEGNLVVNIEAPDGCIGRLLPVQIIDAGPHSLTAEFPDSLTKTIG
jgi:tRNA-2-methylthio-N6-dimethylallyladenosine synthase